MGIENIKAKIKKYISSQLDGFDDFTYYENLVDMAILTDDFIFDLIAFLEKIFCVKLFKHELYSHSLQTFLSIHSISMIIQKKRSQKVQFKGVACNV